MNTVFYLSGRMEDVMPAKNICIECSLSEFSELILEAERNDEATKQLLNHPSVFFEERNFFVPSTARFSVTPTDELRKILQTEEGVDDFLARQNAKSARTSFDVHIKNGIGKCTIITVD
jgi:hypothetical protein